MMHDPEGSHYDWFRMWDALPTILTFTRENGYTGTGFEVETRRGENGSRISS